MATALLNPAAPPRPPQGEPGTVYSLGPDASLRGWKRLFRKGYFVSVPGPGASGSVPSVEEWSKFDANAKLQSKYNFYLKLQDARKKYKRGDTQGAYKFFLGNSPEFYVDLLNPVELGLFNSSRERLGRYHERERTLSTVKLVASTVPFVVPQLVLAGFQASLPHGVLGGKNAGGQKSDLANLGAAIGRSVVSSIPGVNAIAGVPAGVSSLISLTAGLVNTGAQAGVRAGLGLQQDPVGIAQGATGAAAGIAPLPALAPGPVGAALSPTIQGAVVNGGFLGVRRATGQQVSLKEVGMTLGSSLQPLGRAVGGQAVSQGRVAASAR